VTTLGESLALDLKCISGAVCNLAIDVINIIMIVMTHLKPSDFIQILFIFPFLVIWLKIIYTEPEVMARQ